MGKNHKHIKHLKSEKAKVKLKAKKVKHLPKGLNVTDPTFKVKKIVIREQLKQHDETEILSKRKLNVKELLSRLQHHNSTVRQEAVKELKEILSHHTPELLSSQFGPLLRGVSALCLDKEKDIRRDSFKVLGLILGPISNEQLAPYRDVLISYLRCAMTHIDPRIKEDALLFLDVLASNCGSILARNSRKVLPNFLDMISKLHTEMKPGRQLTTTLNSKNTSVKWRSKVLERLADMFRSIVNYHKTEKICGSNAKSRVIRVDKNTKYIPIYLESSRLVCEIDFERKDNAKENSADESLNADEFTRYVEMLMPLIFDSWIEVCPTEKTIDNSELLISSEAAELLKSIVDITQLIIECIDMLHSNCETDVKLWFRNNYQNAYTKNVFSRFPYSKTTTTRRALPFSVPGKSRKRQEDFFLVESRDTCLEQNLNICQIYVWFTSISSNDKFLPRLNKTFCGSIAEYLIDKLESWSNANNQVLPQLTTLLKTLLLKASKIWYANHINLSQVLQSVVNACCDQTNREMQLQLFAIVSDITLDHTLQQLHTESAFKEFVLSLPSLLLKSKIHENTIEIINRVVLRYREWLEAELRLNHDAIIENAKKIEITGSDDVNRSRLMICNLFYFLNTQIYY